MSDELNILKKMFRQNLSEEELMDIFYQNRDSYRLQLNLIQQPRFPEKHALNIISKLFPIDLIRVIKNKRTQPGIRKRSELEFANKYQKLPLGEKISYLKLAPHSLLHYFINEDNQRIINAILNNTNCTEEIVLKFINRKSNRFIFYEEIYSTDWFKRRQVAVAIANDPQAPIRIMIAIIPFLNLRQLQNLYKNEETHQIIRQSIIKYIQNRSSV